MNKLCSCGCNKRVKLKNSIYCRGHHPKSGSLSWREKVLSLKDTGLNGEEIAKKLNIQSSVSYYWLNSEDYREKRKLKNREYYHKTKDDLEKRFKRALRFSRNRAKQTKSKACTATLQELIDSFTGFCKVCNIAEIECNHKLNMDHCHKTGKFRGWLCENCNRALGCVKDDPRILNNLMEYLNENSKRNV